MDWLSLQEEGIGMEIHIIRNVYLSSRYFLALLEPVQDALLSKKADGLAGSFSCQL
jgi:hypothetical protein